MAADDRAAGVLGDEPAAVPVVPVGGDVDAAAERDHPRIDGDRLVVVERQRRSGGERDAAECDVPDAPSVGPTAALERIGNRTGAIPPVAAGAPVRRSARPPAGAGRRRPAGACHPARVAQRGDVVQLAVEPDPLALHRDPGRRVEPVDAMLGGEPGDADEPADEPGLGHRPVFGHSDTAKPCPLA